jgi:hypothetical protein
MSNASFLPEDYLIQKAERRTNLISLTLFGVVMIAVIGAFFVTNRKARLVKQQQETVNGQYQQKALQIQEFKQLEKQKNEMLNKAELAGALVERVPRSILLAELINRMPAKLALLEFELKQEKLKPAAQAAADKDAKGRLATAAKAAKAKTKQQADDKVTRIEPPRYKYLISMLGVAPTDLEVSKYMEELDGYVLLKDVVLEYSEEKEVDGRTMRQFKINMTMDPAADVRHIDPLIVPRLKNPMADEIQFNPPTVNKSASAQPHMPEGR